MLLSNAQYLSYSEHSTFIPADRVPLEQTEKQKKKRSRSLRYVQERQSFKKYKFYAKRE